MKLILKPEYHDAEVRRANITFYGNRVIPEHYINYFNNGFKDLFDVDVEYEKMNASGKKVKYTGIEQKEDGTKA